MTLSAEKHKYNLKLEPPNFNIYEHTFLGLIALQDPVKQGVEDTMARLRAAGIKVIMITGDQAETATAVARKVGIITE